MIDYEYNMKFKTGSFHNNYVKNTLEVTLPQIFNMLPIELLNMRDKEKRENW